MNFTLEMLLTDGVDIGNCLPGAVIMMSIRDISARLVIWTGTEPKREHTIKFKCIQRIYVEMKPGSCAHKSG